jgi:hypothetical protein
MTRSKSAPAIHKPAFDEESVLRFAAQGAVPDAVAARGTGGGDPAAGPTGQKGAKGHGTDRSSITLMLKPEVIARLKDEAARKEKKVDQIVEKLVIKHLGKH